MAGAAPVIETARALGLRTHRDDDLPDPVAMWSDAGVVRFIGGCSFRPDEVAARLALLPVRCGPLLLIASAMGDRVPPHPVE